MSSPIFQMSAAVLQVPLSQLSQKAANVSDNPVMLRYDTSGGHSGIGNVSKNIEELVDEISFLSGRIGLKLE